MEDGGEDPAVAERRVALKALSQAEYAALSSVCDANGLSEGQVVSKADQVEHLEMFLFNYPRMLGLTIFTNLSSLSIMQQHVDAMGSLEQCVHLKTLWVIECQVKKIEAGILTSPISQLNLSGCVPCHST